MDIENKQLRETLEEYKSEFAEVKNQGKDMSASLIILVYNNVI